MNPALNTIHFGYSILHRILIIVLFVFVSFMHTYAQVYSNKEVGKKKPGDHRQFEDRRLSLFIAHLGG